MASLLNRAVLANEVRFHLIAAGGTGASVLLLHGFPQHSHAWRHVMADLACDHTVYALDLRGAGHTDAPRRGYDTATLTADVLAVIDALGLPSVHVVGHDGGAWLGYHLAMAAPDRIASLVAINAPHPWIPNRRLLPHMWRFWYTALFEYPIIGAWLLRTRPGLVRWLLRRGRPELPESDIAIFADRYRDPARARAGQQMHWQVVCHDIPRRLLGRSRRRRLDVRTLAIAGNSDFALAPRSITPAPNIEVRVIDGGHYLPEERPETIATAVREWVAEAP